MISSNKAKAISAKLQELNFEVTLNILKNPEKVLKILRKS